MRRGGGGGVSNNNNICERIDDIIWGETDTVWNDVFSLLLALSNNNPAFFYRGKIMKDVVMPWVHCMMKEYETKYNKVLKIRDEDVIFRFSDGVVRLQSHYHRIGIRYRSAYSACSTIEYSLL